ncbi:site-specific integrase [Bacillus sp. SM2101]|uniref:tyrosine-type recombinase/integrase n=1 Tax=Bacillus sp. SM2101 TaxID=2805366 RepID=UPI001BDF2F16|nr:site-specific integrase [Bacillus sp. SM2101]
MPDGYSNYLREQKKRSELTIDEHVRQITFFFNYLIQKYSKEKVKELYEINSRDVKDYLNMKKSRGLKPKTINKILAILKSYFDYLERVGKVPIDPAVKIPYLPTDSNRDVLNYSRLLEIYPEVLEHPKYSLLRKSIFILAIKGFRISDFHFVKDDIKFYNNTLTILTGENKQRILYLIDKEYEIFAEYYYQTLLDESEYVFKSKSKNGDITPIDKVTVYINLKAIAKDFNIEHFSLNELRLSYAHFLSFNKKMPNNEIANILGTKEESISSMVKRLKDSKVSLET